MTTKPPPEYVAGFEDGHDEGFQEGFSRAVQLIMAYNMTWTREERNLFNKVSRKYFGKKVNNAKLEA